MQYSRCCLAPPQFLLRGYHTFARFFSEDFGFPKRNLMAVYTPHLLDIAIKNSVCLIPLSLAVTNGISIDFFSCGY